MLVYGSIQMSANILWGRGAWGPSLLYINNKTKKDMPMKGGLKHQLSSDMWMLPYSKRRLFRQFFWYNMAVNSEPSMPSWSTLWVSKKKADFSLRGCISGRGNFRLPGGIADIIGAELRSHMARTTSLTRAAFPSVMCTMTSQGEGSVVDLMASKKKSR